jgi:hypothetical protein
MKKITLLVLAIVPAFLQAQTIVYHEDFTVADSVVASGSPLWTSDAVLYTNATAGYKNQVGSAANYLTSAAFSTVGNSFVLLDFDQICKIEYQDAGAIEVSNDNGNTWTQLTYTEYLGTAPFQAMGNHFASSAYANWFPGNVSAVPNNTWWHHETFDISTIAGNAAQVMIRFKLTDGNSNSAGGSYGWVLDQLKVTASPSELFPPVITPLSPIFSGNIFSLGPYTINDSITDASGIASATLYYQVNSGPVQTVTMNNISGNHWAGIIPAVADSDTVCYSVQAFDASPASNSATNPVSGCTQFVAHAAITFPFFDNFDGSSLFTMTAVNTQTQWQIGVPNYGATNSAHSAPNAADINLTTGYDLNASARLFSPVFDFSNVQNARLSFWQNRNTDQWYDGFRIDYTTDGVTWNVLGTAFNDPKGTNWYNNSYLSSSAEAGWDASSNGWVKSEYLLDTLDNVVGPVQFRFVFTSDSWTVINDGVSIDDFLIRSPSPQDASPVAVANPNMSSCVPQGTVPLSVTLLNDGSQAINGPFDVTYILDNGTPVTEQYTGTIQPLQTDVFTFGTQMNLTPGNHTLVIVTDLPGDGWVMNDTLTVSFFTAAGVSVPYLNDFEAGPSTLNDFCVTNTLQGRVQHSATAGNLSASGLVFDASSSLDWDWGSDTIPTSSFYIWNAAMSTEQRANARLIVNTTGYNNLVMEVDMKLLYAWGNEYTNFRISVNGVMITPHLMPNYATVPYTTYRYDLSSFLPAAFITIDFESKVAYDAAVNGTGIYMDNLHIYKPDSLDVGVTQITSPSPITVAGNPATVSVKIRNYGTSTITSIPVAYQVNTSTPVVETWTGSLAPNATTTYTFTTQFTSPSGAYTLTSWSQLPGDTAYWNDTTSINSFGMPLMTVPFFDSFDGPQNFAAVTTTTPSWELGNPAAPYITGTHSGANAWEVNLNGGYSDNATEYLYSPFFDFSQSTNVELRFWQWYSCDNYYDGGRMEFSTDGGNTWTVLGIQFDPNGTSWYNQGYLQSSMLPGWSGNGGGYFQSKYNLSMFNNYPNPVQFRFVFTSDGWNFGANDGWAIDDFELFMPIDAGTSTIQFAPSPLPMTGTNNVKVNVVNTGLIPLNTVSVTLKIDNTVVVTDVINFSTALAPGTGMVHTFSLPWNGATPGYHTVKCWTSGPNGFVDVVPANDTTTWTVSVMDQVTTYPWCNNFETGNGKPPLTTMNAQRFTNTNCDWVQGDPNKNIITSAHGGTNCWITNLTLNYIRNDSAGLFTPVFIVDTMNCYHLEFWSYMLTPVSEDAGTVEYSYDNGLTWQPLGIPLEPNWFTHGTATGLGPGFQPNISGTSPGWVLKQHDVRFSQAGPVIFRFRFGSTSGLETEGWAIDDVCFNQIPPCVLSTPEIPQGDFAMTSYPNPASNSSVLTYTLPASGAVTIVLRDALGQEVATFSGEQAKGENTWTIDVSNLADGVYFYEFTFEGQTVVQKMVVTH